LIAFVIFIIVSIIFLVIMFFVINAAAKLVFGSGGDYSYAAILATGLIVAASLVGGGTLFKFKN